MREIKGKVGRVSITTLPERTFMDYEARGRGGTGWQVVLCMLINDV